jgi:hypothetical protein
VAKGLYRIPGGVGQPNFVQVEDAGNETPVRESQYVTRKTKPLLATLKWRDAYFEGQRKEALKSAEPVTAAVAAKTPGGGDA